MHVLERIRGEMKSALDDEKKDCACAARKLKGVQTKNTAAIAAYEKAAADAGLDDAAINAHVSAHEAIINSLK